MFKTSRNNYFNQFENISDSEKTHTISHNEQPQIPKSKNSDKRPKWRNNNFVNLYVMTQMLTTVKLSKWYVFVLFNFCAYFWL